MFIRMYVFHLCTFSHSPLAHYRRPFGGGVLELSGADLISGREAEVVMPIYVPSNDREFATLHESVLKQSGVELFQKAKA